MRSAQANCPLERVHAYFIRRNSLIGAPRQGVRITVCRDDFHENASVWEAEAWFRQSESPNAEEMTPISRALDQLRREMMNRYFNDGWSVGAVNKAFRRSHALVMKYVRPKRVGAGRHSTSFCTT